MCPLEDSNATDSFDQELVVIKGGTDNTSIGNVGDRLKTDTNLRDGSGNAITSTTVSSKQSLDINVTHFDDTTASGTITANGQSVTATTTGCSTASFYVSGTWVATLQIEATIDDTNYFNIYASQKDGGAPGTIFQSITSNNQFVVNCGGFKKVRIRASAFTSGTVSITWIASAGQNVVSVFSPNAASLQSTARVNDGSGNAITSSLLPNAKQSLDVHIAEGYAEELYNGRVFSAAVQVNQASGGTDNPLILFRNPVGSGKSAYIHKILTGVEVTNVQNTFKLFVAPTLSNTVATISNITQAALSTTVTVTTSTAHGATVGATAVITGTTNFNGTWTVAGVTSSTIYTFTKTAVLLTTTETSGTSTVNSSLGTSLSSFALKRVASPASAVSLLTTLPTVSSNGSLVVCISIGQNSNYGHLAEDLILSLEAGQNMLIAGLPASNNRSATVTVIWSEV